MTGIEDLLNGGMTESRSTGNVKKDKGYYTVNGRTLEVSWYAKYSDDVPIPNGATFTVRIFDTQRKRWTTVIRSLSLPFQRDDSGNELRLLVRRLMETTIRIYDGE